MDTNGLKISEGTVVGGYRVLTPRIAEGGSGCIHLAKDFAGRKVALKFLAMEKIIAKVKTREKSGEELKNALDVYIQKFKNEFSILSGLTHRNIAKAISFGYFEGAFYSASEFIEGQPLAEYERGRKPDDMVPLFIQALAGLDFIHRSGLVHLDVKSENVLVTKEGQKPVVKIIDFGLAIPPSEYTGEFLGSVPYIAPEIALGRIHEVDARADLFSFGVLMHHCITWGAFPFPRTSSKETKILKKVIENEKAPRPPSMAHKSRPGFVPKYMDKIVLRLLAKEPEDRFYGNARAVVNALATHRPDTFGASSNVRGAYLKPAGNAHIGRKEIKDAIENEIEGLKAGKRPLHPIYFILGGCGMGKSHFLRTVHGMIVKFPESLSSIFVKLSDADATTNMLLNKNVSVPHVILIDDIDVIAKDSDTIRGIFRVDKEGTGPPMLIIAALDTANKDEIVNLLQICGANCASFKLTAFTEAEVGEYLSSTPAFANEKVPPMWVKCLHSATGGVPAELSQHLEALDNDGHIFDSGGRIIVPTAILPGQMCPPIAPPATKQRLLDIYHSLSPAERGVCIAISVWHNKNLSPPLLAEDLNTLNSNFITGQHLRMLIQKGIVETGEDGIKFSDLRLHNLIYEESDIELRERLHSQIAGMLSCRAQTDANAIALHRGFASDRRRAICALIGLARRKLNTEGKAGLACELLDHARELTESNGVSGLLAMILALQAEARFCEGNLILAEELCSRGLLMAESAKNNRIQLHILMRHISVLIRLGRLAEAQESVSRAESLCQGRGRTCHPVLINHRARIFFEKYMADTSGQASSLGDALSLCRKGKNAEALLPRLARRQVTNNCLSQVLSAMGDNKVAAREAKENLNEHDHNVFSVCSLNLHLAEVSRLARRYKESFKSAKAAVELSIKIGLPPLVATAHRVQANIYHDMDRFEDALAEDRLGLAANAFVADENTRKKFVVRAQNHMGHCCKELGKTDKAIAHFESAIASGASGPHLIAAEVGMGEVYFTKGNFDKAREYLTNAMMLASNLPRNVEIRSYAARVEKILGKLSCGSRLGTRY